MPLGGLLLCLLGGLLSLCAPRATVQREEPQDLAAREDPAEGVRHALDTVTVNMLARAHAGFEAGEYSRAWEDYELALRREQGLGRPQSLYPMYTGLGNCALMRRDFDIAIEQYSKALALNPGFYQALSGRAAAYQGKSEFGRAVAEYEEALVAKPDGQSARFGLGVSRLRLTEETRTRARRLAETGNLDESAARFREVLAMAPELEDVARELVDVLERAGEFEQAASEIDKLLLSRPEDTDLLMRLASLRERLGDQAGAITAYARVLKVDPGNEKAGHAYEQALFKERSRELPADLAGLDEAREIRRDALAALLAFKIPLRHARRPFSDEPPVILIDIGASWAKRYIQEVVGAGFMAVYDNHTFRPSQIVSRMDLADSVHRVVERFVDQGITHEGRKTRSTIRDVPPEHVMHDAIQDAVTRGIMETYPAGGFEPNRKATGREAIDVVERLAALAR